MNCEQTTMYNDSFFQMIPPLCQPLRLWTPRVSPVSGRVRRSVDQKTVTVPLHAFTVKGGFVNFSGGERRMVIAGKIFRRQG